MARHFRVTIEGRQEVFRSLQQMKIKAADLANAWETIGGKIKQDAIRFAPVLTGRLASTIRSSKGKTRATVRAGNNRMPPYAPVIHYGGYNNIEPHPFLTRALHQNADFAVREVEKEINDIIDRLDLNRVRVT